MADEVGYDDDFEADEGEGVDEDAVSNMLQNLVDNGQLSSGEAKAIQDLEHGDDAVALNKALHDLETRLMGPAAGRPPLPPGSKQTPSKLPVTKSFPSGAASSSKPTDSSKMAGTSHAAGRSEAPKREVRRPSEEKRGSEGMLQVAMKGATFSDWEPQRQAREDASFSNDELFKIRRDNIILLSKLERIHRKGGSLPPASTQKHTATSFVNRKKNLKNIGQQNSMLLRRLENVKSTMGGPSHARPGPPRKPAATSASRPVVQPSWQA